MDVYLHSSILVSFLRILLVILITLLLNIVIRSYVRVPKRLDTRRRRTYLAVVRSAITVVIFAIALHIIFIILGINITPLLASAGIVGIAIGIGARTLIEDLIAGVFLLTQATTTIGDYVLIGSTEGVIQDIGFRTITIRGINGASIVIPNGQVKQVVNYSSGHAVLFIDIPVKADQELEKVSQALTAILTALKKDEKLKHPITDDSKVVGIENIQQGNCILIRTMLITSPGGRNNVEYLYRSKVMESFKKNKIALA